MFESERLILRPMLLEDTEKLFEYRSRVRDNEYQSFVPTSIEEVREFIQKCSQEFNVNDTWFQLVIIKEDNNLIGDIGVHFIGDEQVEFGITLNKEFQNNGYAFEAISYLFNILFNQFNKHRITASVDPRNINSIKLLKKLQMRKEVHHIKSYFFKDEWVDDCIYAILKEEFILL